MPLGGNCCCGCTLLADSFQRANTSGSAASRLGANWSILAGSPQIVGDTLEMSAGDAIAWLGGFSSLLGLFEVAFSSIADGTVFRIYMGCGNVTSIPSTNYVEYTYHPYAGTPGNCITPDMSAPQSMFTSVGLTTQTLESPESPLSAVSDGSSVICTGTTNGVAACIGQDGSTYHLAGFHVGGVAGSVTQVDMVPAGSSVVLQLVSASAPVQIAGVGAYDTGPITSVLDTPLNAGTCNDCHSTCGCNTSQFSVTLAGIPSACSSGILNGAYTLLSASLGDPLDGTNRCLLAVRGIEDQVPWISFSYNPFTNTSTVLGLIYLCVSGSGCPAIYAATISGPIVCADLEGVVLTYQSGSGGTGCAGTDLASSTMTITAVT